MRVLLGAEPVAGSAPNQQAAPAVAPAAAEQHFNVSEYRVLGNSVLAPEQIERVLYPLLGPSKTLRDVEVARAALEKLYHDAGYGTVYVDIPPQEVSDGVVRLRVTEGRIARSEINGARYFSERDLRVRIPAAQSGRVLRIPDLQQQLNAVNAETADRSVLPVLKAGPVPGTVDLSLTVHDQLPLHASLELNNQASIDTKPLRLVATLSYANLFGRLDNLSLQYQATPQQFDQVRVIAVNYAAHPWFAEVQPSLFYINSNSNVATVGALGVLGEGEIAGARLGFPIATGTNTVQSLTLGLDYKHFRNTVTENATTAFVTPISYVNVSLTYAGNWRSERSLSTVSLAADFGPRGFANSAVAFANYRFKGRSNYFYLRGAAAIDFRLPADFNVHLRAAGQAAFEPIISNENYSIAGVDGVRGYLESEELGDTGIKGTLQLRLPGLHRHDRQLATAYLFYDAGRTGFIDPLPGQPGKALLRSWGVGFDALPGQRLTASLTWAEPLVASSATRAGESRLLFLVRGAF
jgi:hemolysin activation/secretion protein